MVRERFDESFEKLREQSNKLAATERTTDNYDEIVEQRVELDRLRDEVTAERKNIVSRFEPPATDVVEPPRGYQHTNRIGKAGAIISIGLIIACLAAVYVIGRAFLFGPDVYVDSTQESVVAEGDACLWTVEATIRNDTDEAIEVTRMQTILDRAQLGTIDADLGSIPAGVASSNAATGTWRFPAGDNGCPAAADIDHGNLILSFDGTQISRDF